MYVAVKEDQTTCTSLIHIACLPNDIFIVTKIKFMNPRVSPSYLQALFIIDYPDIT
jgi:hypothetical protein